MSSLKNISVQSPTEDEKPKGGGGDDWSKLIQHATALSANLSSLSAGLCLGWSSPALPLIQRPDENNPQNLPLCVDSFEGSWISCLCPLGAALGALPAGKMADCMGRKKALLSLALPFIVGWLLILFADDSVIMVYAGRFIGGLAVGASCVLAAQYNEEISEDSIRGALGVYLDFSQCVGVLLVNAFGCFMSYNAFTITSAVFPVLFVCIFVWMPESPLYLVSQDREDDAKKSLMFLRKGKISYNVYDEIQYFRDYLKRQAEERDTRPIAERLKEISFKSVTFKIVFIVFGLMFFQQAGGVNGILFNAVAIFESAGSEMSSNISSVVLSTFQTASDFASSLYVDRLGRRPMLLISAFVTAICQGILSIYFYFKDDGYNVDDWSWVPLTALIVWIVGFTAGFSPLPWLMNAELTPTKHQYWSIPVATTLNWGMAFLVTKEYPDMVQYLGNDGTYGLFCAMCVASLLFVWFFVPETKGKSREQIEEMMKRGRK